MLVCFHAFFKFAFITSGRLDGLSDLKLRIGQGRLTRTLETTVIMRISSRYDDQMKIGDAQFPPDT